MQKTKFFVQQVARQKAAIAGGKVRSVATAVTTSRPAGKIPFQFGSPRPGAMSGKILPTLVAVRGGPSVWGKESGRIKPLQVFKTACGGQKVRPGGACATCGATFGQITAPRTALRTTRKWFSPVLPASQLKSWVSSPTGALSPGASGAWLTPAQLSAATAFMRQGGA